MTLEVFGLLQMPCFQEKRLEEELDPLKSLENKKTMLFQGIIFSMKQVFLSAFVCKILGNLVPNLSQEGCDY